jgi:hypothetical protein
MLLIILVWLDSTVPPQLGNHYFICAYAGKTGSKKHEFNVLPGRPGPLVLSRARRSYGGANIFGIVQRYKAPRQKVLLASSEKDYQRCYEEPSPQVDAKTQIGLFVSTRVGVATGIGEEVPLPTWSR